MKKIVQGLLEIKEEIEQGKFPWRKELEDVHLNIEMRLTELIGDVGKKTAYCKEQKRPSGT